MRELYERHGGNVARVVQDLGLGEFSPTQTAYRPRRHPPIDPGRPELRKYIVSMRHVDSPVWPIEDEVKIEAARKAYEAGTHEMCQGRDKRGWFILYLIPRRRRVGARKFFHMEDFA